MGAENKVNKGLILGIVIGVIGVAVAAIAIVLVLSRGNGSNVDEAEAERQRKAVVTADNVEEVIEDLTTVEPTNIPQSYTVSQNSEWHFIDGKSESTDAFVENVASNETPVYFVVVLDDTGEEVYSSPILELGASISGFKLDKPLAAGTYTCTIDYHLVDDDQNELTMVHVGGTLIVEN